MKISNELKETIKRHYYLYSLSNWILRVKTMVFGGVRVENYGNGRFKKDVIGHNNIVIIGKKTMIYKSSLRIRGDNNKIVIGENCKIRKGCSFWIQGNNSSIIIGDNVTMRSANHFHAQEDGRSIIIGNDCMISNHIIVRTSDSHGIFDAESKIRLNNPKDIIIGNHVWIAPNSMIFKGAVIDDGSVIGSNTLVTKHIPSNCLAVGMPAKVVKENIIWSRSRVLENN